MTSSSGTESSEEDESTDGEYSSRRKNLPPKSNRKHDNKFKPIGPDSGSSFVDVSKAKPLNEYIYSISFIN